MKKIKSLAILSLLFAFSSCSPDDSLERKEVSEELVTKTANFLNGEIVLGTHATMNGISKTLLPQGCPTKFYFKWNSVVGSSFTIQLMNFTVGKMPVIVNFECNVKIIQLNSWEKAEYKGEGWIKFNGVDGSVISEESKEGGQTTTAKGSMVKGYYNVNTHEINFIIDYNMMNVRSECFLQTIDKNRIKNYEEEFAQYERDLEAYKKEHGL